MKKMIKRCFAFFLGEKLVNYIGVKNIVLYFFFQRVLRVNSHVKWRVHWSSIVTYPERIKMNYWRPFLGFLPNCYIQAMNGIEIGKNVRIGPSVKLISASHDVYDYDLHTKHPPIIIEDNCWIAANVTILPGVQLGDHTVVAAGAVVNKSFLEGNCIIGGIPAKIIKKLDSYKGEIEW